MTDPAHSLKHVLSPLAVGSANLRNRIVRTGHATKYIKDGQVTDQLVAYHLERARGGVGMSVLEVASVHPSSYFSGYLLAYQDKIIDGWGRLADTVHQEGMAVFTQLWHGGNRWNSATGEPPWSASSVPSVVLGTPPVPMTKGMIDDVVAGFASAAGRAQRAGLDGVELHAAHGYLLEQFLSPLTNHREDEYGGSLENRLRFLIEALRAVRAQVGAGYPVGVRIGASQWLPGGLEPPEMVRAAQLIEASGLVDFVDVSVGVHETHHRMIGPSQDPHLYQLPEVTPVTAALTVPRLITGRVHTLREAEQIIASGQADLVSMVRALIADPHLVRKTLAGQEPRPCVGQNNCLASGKTFTWMGCDANPLVGFEARLSEEIPPAPDRRRIVVVGAGPAGLEAARTAALRGHEVLLYEAADETGGQLRLCRAVPGRTDLANLVAWQARRVAALGVEVRTGVRVDAATLRGIGAVDHVVVATGPRRRARIMQTVRGASPVEGELDGGVVGAWELLAGSVPVPRTAVVLDDVGHHEGYSVAEFLVAAGCRVTLVTRHLSLAPTVELSQVPARMRERFAESGVAVVPRGYVARIGGGTATLGSLDGGPEWTVPAEVVVPVLYHEPDRELAEALRADGHTVHVVGDAVTQRFLQTAIGETHRLVREL